MTSKFGSLIEYGKAADARSEFFEASTLPDIEKERLARMLLAEFGADVVNVSPDGEMIHSCVLPFGLHAHGDRSPSASLNYRRLTYNCFSCGGGGLLWFIGVCRGTSGAEAKSWLQEQTGTGGKEQPLSALLAYFDAVYGQETPRPTPLPKMDPRVLDPWMVIHPYLTDVRHIPLATLQRQWVGYGEIPVRGTVSPRVVIPHFWRGELVGWQSRRLTDDGTPKYLSSPDFPKDTTLYNFRPKKPVVVVESPMSALRHLHHQPITATFGATVTARQVKLLAGAPRITLWMDNDEAGWRSTEQLAAVLDAYSPVYVVESDWAADPADMDDDTVDQLIGDAVPFSIWHKPRALKEWA